jgi:general secretion pathway protein K
MHARSRGFALIMVIWGLVVMLGLSAGFAMAVRHETRIASDALDGLQREAAAIAARNLAIIALTDAEEDRRWRPDGTTHPLQWGDAAIAVRVTSESGRIDINRAPRPVLLGLMETLLPDRQPEALADALIDWRDRDDRPSPAGAEADDYRAAGLGYVPANAPLHSVAELSRVIGFGSDVVERLRPHITVHSRRPRVNAISADALTLAALPGIDMATARQFVAERDAVVQGGELPMVDALRDGRRFVELNLDDRVVALDLRVALPATPPYTERVVLTRDNSVGYRLLARRPTTPADRVTGGQP